jgi:hypothetical protein
VQEGFQFFGHPRVTVSLFSPDSFAFAHGGHIAVAFLTQHTGKDLLAREASRELHLISLDAATGKVLANRTWPVPGATLNNAYVGATREGNFVVLQGSGLRVYSSDLREINRLDLPADSARSHSSWSLLVPPGGDSIFLRRYFNGSSSLQMLSAATLHVVRSWDKSEESGWVSGKYFARLGKDKKLYARAFDTPWRPIADLSPCRGAWQFAATRFVNEDSLIVSRCDSVQWLRVNGQVLFTAHAPEGCLISDAWGSPDGRFVAMGTTTMGGLKIALALDMSRGAVPRRILVYDTKSGTPVAALRFTWQHACAFSPDSSALALLSGGIVEMLSLPRLNK